MVKNKKLIILILQLCLMAIFVIGTYTFSQKELELVEVYKYTKNINENVEIEVSDLQKVSIPQSAVDKNFLTSDDYNKIAEGNKVLATRVEAGQYAYSNQIMDGNKVDPFEKIDLSKYRKVTIPANYASSVSGEISRGDRIDLAYVGQAEGSTGEVLYSTVFMQNVLVYSVNTSDGFEYVEHSQIKKSQMYGTEVVENASNDALDYENEIALITLAVPMKDVEEIIARSNSGKISVVGRFDTSVDTDAPGYYIGKSQNASTNAGNKLVEK